MIRPNNIRGFVLPLLTLIVSIVLLTLYMLKTTTYNKQIQNKNKEITDLNEKLIILEEVITNSNVKTEQPKEEPVNEGGTDENTHTDMNFPFINYVPEGIFTDDEKEQLEERLISPFFDFNNEDEELYIALIIVKLGSADNEGDFRFDIQTLDRYGNYGGFLYGEGDKLEWWLPDCLDGCDFTEKFEQKYPEIIEEYKH